MKKYTYGLLIKNSGWIIARYDTESIDINSNVNLSYGRNIEELKNYFNSELECIDAHITLCFDTSCDDIERIDVLYYLQDVEFNNMSVIEKPLAAFLWHVFDTWTTGEGWNIKLGEAKNYLTVEVEKEAIYISCISLFSSLSKTEYNLIASSSYNNIGINLIDKTFVKYVIDEILLNDYKDEITSRLYEEYDFYYSNGIYSEEISYNFIKYINQVLETIISSKQMLTSEGVAEIDLTHLGYRKINFTLGKYEQYVLAMFKSNIKELLEQFYIDNKDKMDNVVIDEIIFFGELAITRYLSRFISRLFNKSDGENIHIIDSENYSAKGAALYTALILGRRIEPFLKDNIGIIESDIVVYQRGADGNILLLLEKGTSYSRVNNIQNTLKIQIASQNPLNLVFKKKSNMGDITLYELSLYLPVYYNGDSLEIDFKVENYARIKGSVKHLRTKIEKRFEFNL